MLYPQIIKQPFRLPLQDITPYETATSIQMNEGSSRQMQDITVHSEVNLELNYASPTSVLQFDNLMTVNKHSRSLPLSFTNHRRTQSTPLSNSKVRKSGAPSLVQSFRWEHNNVSKWQRCISDNCNYWFWFSCLLSLTVTKINENVQIIRS